MNKTVQKIKKIGGSPIFLISAIAFTASTVLGVIGSTATAEGLKNAAMSFLTSQDTLSGFGDKLNTLWAALPAGAIGASVFSLLVAIGMWMHFAASKSDKNPPSTMGMTMIKIVKVIELIAIILAMVLIVIILGMVFIAVGGVLAETTGEITSAYWIVLGAIAVIAIISVVMTVMYYMGIFRTIKSVRMTLNTGVIMGKVSVFVIVINYFMAAIALVVAVLSPDVIVMAGGICYVVALVMSSIAMGNLRSEMLYIASRGSSAIE